MQTRRHLGELLLPQAATSRDSGVGDGRGTHPVSDADAAVLVEEDLVRGEAEVGDAEVVVKVADGVEQLQEDAVEDTCVAGGPVGGLDEGSEVV
jgi:hypothetical protein